MSAGRVAPMGNDRVAPGDNGRARHPILRRLLAIVVGWLLVPIALEIGLQIAALFPERSRAGASGASLVLCQGDSNTFGFNLPAELSYPAQLEALIRGGGGADARVVNRGVPGKPTWVVRDEIAGDLAQFSPRALVILCGLNDRNMVRPDDLLSRLSGSLRTANMIRRLVSAAREREAAAFVPEEEEQPNVITERSMEKIDETSQRLHFKDRSGSRRPFLIRHGEQDVEVFRAWIAADLAALAREARASGVTPILATYAIDDFPFSNVNVAIERAAQDSGAHLVDARPWFVRGFERVGRDALLFPDDHPTELGYSIFARLVLQALQDEGVLGRGAPIDPLERLSEWRAPRLEVEAWNENGALVGVHVRYRTGCRAQLLLAESEGTTPIRWAGAVRAVAIERRTHDAPLAHDALFDAGLLHAIDYIQTLDGDGRIDIRLQADVLEHVARGRALWAAAVAIQPGQHIAAVSPALRLQ